VATRYPELFAALAAPFHPSQVKTRSGGNGRQLSYITARTAANRLDEVVGPENWDSDFFEVRKCLACRITVRLPDGSTVSKSDGGGFKEMTMKDHGQDVIDQENTDKTAFSDAFKRAAAMFGVGRYLYRDGVPDFGVVHREPPADPNGSGRAPAGAQGDSSRATGSPAGAGGTNGQYGDPATGSQLYAWAKRVEDDRNLGMVKWLDNEAKLAGLPKGPWKDWPDDIQFEWVPKLHAKAVAQIEAGEQRHPVDPDAVGTADEFTIQAQRKKLKKLILQRACHVTGKGPFDLTDAERMAALAECDNVRVANGGTVLSGRIDDCTDAGLLAAYIAAAEGVVEAGAL
jgi:hypothetical protein